MSRLSAPLGALCLLSVLACQREATPERPSDVARVFLETFQKAHGDPVVADKLYRMLWSQARKNLEERARRASALSGRTVGAGEMLVPSWFTFLAATEPVGERVETQWAEVLFELPSGGEARTRLHLEEGHWKVALDLPELPPIRERVTERDPKDDEDDASN